MTDEWAIVTGGSQGIGAAICECMRASGLAILVLDRQAPKHTKFDEFLEVDLFEPQASAGRLKEILGDRKVTRLIHNAGICLPASLQAASLDEIGKEFAVSTLSLIALAQVVVPLMQKAGKGRIVALGSRAALGKPERTGYSAAKSALTGLVRTWALELGAGGITVNVVAPAATQTQMMQDSNPSDGWFMRNLVARIPVGFIADPIDVANVVAFLASDQARFVTGQVLNVCGGTSIGFIEK